MSYFHEKIILGLAGLASSSVALLGAVMVADEAMRYFYATASIAILTAVFLALVFRRTDETIRLVIGRCGLSILSGIFGTRWAIHYFQLQQTDADIVLLMGLAGVVTIAGFLVGFALLKIINRKASQIAEKIADKYIGVMDSEDDEL